MTISEDCAGPMIKRLFLILVLAMTAGAAVAQPQTKIRIGIGIDYPPFYHIDANDQPTGFEIDLARALCDEMKVECTFVTNRWDQMIPALLAGKFDAIMSSMSITNERRKFMIFSERYYSCRMSMVARRGGGVDPRNLETLASRTVGLQRQTTHQNYAESYFVPAGMRVQQYTMATEALLDLKRGAIDAVLGDKIALLKWLGGEQGQCCALVGDDFTDNEILGEGIGVGMRPTDVALKAKFDMAIAAIRANGVYQTINERYFAFDIY